MKRGQAPTAGLAQACLAIGVTGHRRLADEARVAAKIDAALDDIVKQAAGEGSEGDAPAPRLCVVSPLAEGADRLVARRVLAREGAALEAVLPMDEVDYSADFKTEASRLEFRDLLARARAVHWMSRAASREEAYAAAGRYVVDHCDVLIAVWDGRPANGPGGTADIVAYARSRSRRLFLIEP